MNFEDFTLVQNDTIAGILYTIFTLAFIIVPFIVYIVKKNDNTKLIEKYMKVFPNPDEAMEAYYRDKENFTVVEPYRKNSLIAIIYYFFVMYILAEIIAAIAIVIYLQMNGFSRDIINPNSDSFNPDVYEHMANILNLVLEMVLYTMLTVGVVIIMWKPFKKDLSNISKKTFAFGAMGYGLTMAGNFASTILFGILGITARKGEASNQEAITSMFNSSPLAIVILFLTIVIMAPIVEELIFRKGIFTLIKDPKLAIIISSLIFGGLHVISPTISTIGLWLSGEANYLDVILEFVYIIQYSLMGLGFSIAYVKSNKNVSTTIFSHMLNNGISFAMLLLLTLLPSEIETIINFLI